MVSAAAVRFAVGVLGNIISLFLFLSPVPTFVSICKKGSVEQYSPVPYLATFINCMLWVLYGLPFVHPNSVLVVTINGAGCFIELVYLLLFVIYSGGGGGNKKRLKVISISILEIVIVAVIAAMVLCLAHGTQSRSRIVGLIAIACNIMMYAAPLSVVKMVITTRSVEYMPFFLSLASFANGVAWTVYALRPFDPYIFAPNGLGSLFSLAQLLLYATYYKSTKEQIAARKPKSEMALAQDIVGPEPNKVSHVSHINQEA
uniref:Bidirectional sugar transporter SWEET n=1 Tax=Nepenthes sp. MF-2019 TaxID=2518353 RepID=A0A482JVD4_9CARY|nr:SWEET4-like bidirectional sugar transporter [Nepenthes sp. MF-2019]